jgi:hypothetical protein
LDPLVDLRARSTEGNDAGQVGQVRAPAAVVGLFENGDDDA